jgi:hypothetical protein
VSSPRAEEGHRASLTLVLTSQPQEFSNHLASGDAPPLLHFARRQDVAAWAPMRLQHLNYRSVRNVTE